MGSTELPISKKMMIWTSRPYRNLDLQILDQVLSLYYIFIGLLPGNNVE